MKYLPAKSLLAVLPLTLLAVSSAQTLEPLSARANAAHPRAQPQAIQLQGFEYIIPQLIFGGEWTSTIKLTNRGTKAIPTTNVDFYDNFGNPMRATFRTSDGGVTNDTGFSFSLPVGGLLEGVFTGDSSVQFGHAIVGCSVNGCGTPGLYGEVTLRNRNSTRPDFESVFPFESPASFQYMLFDGRNGFTTTLYLVNESTNSTTVTIEIVDTKDRLLRTVNIPFRGLESQILTLHVLAQETIGVQGTLVISSPSSSVLITATGLRINPSNSFTPLRTFIPSL